MKVYIIIPSINVLTNVSAFKDETDLMQHEVKIIVVDEGDKGVRKANESLLSGFQCEFYGPTERMEWFKARFGSKYRDYLKVIPERCHAETSFGFLVAFEEEPDVVVELDDDVYPVKGHNVTQSHIDNLLKNSGVTLHSESKWYNTIENLSMKTEVDLYPRGHPYSPDVKSGRYVWKKEKRKCALNMGLWSSCLDLDALTILYHGGLDGRYNVEGIELKRRKVVVGAGTYFAVCSMNTAFVPKIIPAFYQLYMKYMGVDRFDDVWSGIFLKKISDQVGDGVCLGRPLVLHNKRPRNTFKDLRAELEGMVINEALWRIVDALELDGKTYFDAYNSLTAELEKSLKKFDAPNHRKFMGFQIEKMKLWLDGIDRLQ